MDDIELLKKKLEREKKARLQAEAILEEKALDLHFANEQLRELNKNKDAVIQATSEALKALFKYDDVDSSVKQALNIIGPASNADRAIVFFSTELENVVPDIKYYLWDKEGKKPKFDIIPEDKLQEFQNKLTSYFSTKDNVFEFSYSNSGSLEKLLMDASGIKLGLFYPILFNEKFIGIFGLEYFEEEKRWSDTEVSILKTFAAGIGSALEKKATRYTNEQQKKFYESVLNSIPSDLVVFDRDHKYKFINPLAIKDKDVREWLIDKDDFDYVKYRDKPVSLAENRREMFQKMIKDKKIISFEEKFITKSGDEEWKHRYMYPVIDNESNDVEMVIGYAMDISDIKKTQSEIGRISKRLSTLISSLNSGILLEDQNRNILVTNQNFCDMFSIPVPPNDLIGFDCSDSAEQSKHLIENEEYFVSRIDEIVGNKKIVTNEEVRFKDGRIFERDFIPIYNDDQYLGHLWEYRDITHRKESERLLIKAREEAEESKRMKQKFLANMSHEIRTPMNGVIGIVHLLERTSLDQKQSKYLNILKDSSEHLLHIINDILDVSKIEEGKLVLVKSPIQMDSVIEGVIQNLRSRVKDKKLRLEVSGLEIFDTHLMSDPVRIRQILLNLLSNAIKFTHKGKISVNCLSMKEDDESHEFKIEVSDTGIGIALDRVDRIFEAFDQENVNTSVQYGGTGLGLNIVKELVQKMGGEIAVTSELGKGSTFSIALKLDKADSDFSPFENESEDFWNDSSLNGKRILVADDHEVNFTIAREILNNWGAEIFYAKDGEEAVHEVLEKEIDLVLMDMQMPNVDGIEATKMIRMLPEPKSSVPIVAMTAAALPEERERCLQSGMNDYISKPYNPSLLFEILNNHINGSDVASKEQGNSSNQTGTFDLTYLKDLSGNNTAFILEMINAFVNEMPELINEIILKLREDDLDEVSRIAHKAKSMSSYLGCTELQKLFSEIEYNSDHRIDTEKLEPAINQISSKLDIVIPNLKEVEL